MKTNKKFQEVRLCNFKIIAFAALKAVNSYQHNIDLEQLMCKGNRNSIINLEIKSHTTSNN